MILARVESKTDEKIDGMEFNLTTRLPYITVVSPVSDVLHRCHLKPGKDADGYLIYEHTETVGVRIPF